MQGAVDGMVMCAVVVRIQAHLSPSGKLRTRRIISPGRVSRNGTKPLFGVSSGTFVGWNTGVYCLDHRGAWSSNSPRRPWAIASSLHRGRGAPIAGSPYQGRPHGSARQQGQRLR
jgi:hypothetical protein